MYQNLTSDISQSRPHTSSIFMSFSIKSGTRNSKMEWKPEPEIVFGAILAKNQISGFLGLVSRWYVYVRRRRDRQIGLSTSDALDRRRELETELLCPGEPTPITLSVLLPISVLYSQGLCLASFPRYYCSVLNCLWPLSSPSVSINSWNYKSHILSDLYLNISYLIRTILSKIWKLKRF